MDDQLTKNMMNLKIPDAIVRATRLVRGGSLLEATKTIQRALRGGDVPVVADPPPADAATIDGTFHVVDAEPRSTAGRFVTRKFSNAAGARQYKIYTPGLNSGQALPL